MAKGGNGLYCALLEWTGIFRIFFANSLFFFFVCLKVQQILQVIDFDLPITVQLTVVDVDPGLKGDTAQGKH